MSALRLRLLAALLCAAVTLSLARRAHAGDPYLRWYTIETPSFHVHFHGGLEEAAQRTASLAELIHRRLLPDLGYVPSEITHILVTDITDAANGSASVVPYNALRMFVSAPDDMSPLGDYDDWLTELLTHEHSHILHVGNVSGLPALVNAVLGKTVAPNQAQPRWILEGLAVAMESAHTSGGRVRSTQFDMYLRADVLEHRLAALDQMSHALRRWPSGNIFYLYGGHFISWIHELYGPDVFAAVANDYGSNIIPWGINRSIRRATGRTYIELYEGWKEHLRRKYAAQTAEVRRRGLREGVRLTHHGRSAASPRFLPAGCRSGPTEELVYLRDDGHLTAGIYRVPLGARREALGDEITMVSRASGKSLTFDAECGLVFDGAAPSERRYVVNDLFRQAPGTRSTRGFDRSRRRLTVGRRARDPDVSPDGRQIAYVTNDAGTTTLRLARLTADYRVVEERRLVPSARHEQAFNPRFSPDGRRVAYSAWTAGGYRDIRVVELETGRLFELMHDRALDQQPVWSADGKTLFFSSDRTGISNVYAFDFETRRLHQVTNVLTGAFMPEPTPDGRTLFYVGYTSAGFDLFSLPLDRSRWLRALPAPRERPAPPPEPILRRWPVREYNPLTTLRPRNYDVQYGPGTFGQSLTLSTGGADIVGLHGFRASITVQTQEAEPHAALDYVYRRLPFDVRTSVFRTAAPRTGFRFGDQAPIVTERLTGITTGISYGIPGEFQSQSVSLSYSAVDFKSELPLRSDADPFSLVTRQPHEGFLATIRLGYGYSNVEGSTWGISLEKGLSLSLAADVAAEEWGSDSTLTMFSGRATGYVPMPWDPHHVLALAASGGAAVGTFPRRGLFFTGGFVDSSIDEIIDSFTTGLRQGAFVLRGYVPGQFIGSQFNLLNAEYRLPIAYIERGISTLPVFFRTVSAAAFADFGGAYDQLDLEDPLESFHLGVGAELWFDVVMGYVARSNLRLGFAHGLDDEAPGLQTYFVVSSAF